ncbi:MAG: hypothetical protein J3K34DRAFT_416364 [Monoraphidium minutum]|nr:MAG: hypothetical protein J3K34DRAFT_416364 [Monoraphidium minutum]
MQCGAATTPGGGRLKLCSGCRSVRFCSDKCQRLGWKARHRDECAALQAARLQRLSPQGERQQGEGDAGAASGSGGQAG